MDTGIPHRRPKDGLYAIRSFLLHEVDGFPGLRMIKVVVGEHHELSDWAQLRELGWHQQIVVRIMHFDGGDVD
ncbi:uncharacterized protein N7496_006277 [Penicillium cataractarum]|uniref:Uncharacterized protein n=1 Tax=Penicillium cataractarum TaxID=2100454 RepID=A0A9W9S2L7_9EURO|nr:uncharacterized protein N7496_006277 [Penicillium cataractarum]KAJ5370185.1 hypothetical protein N7496_006277 [Penicillium cataractarum]